MGPVVFGTLGVDVYMNGGKVDVDVGGSSGVVVSIWGPNVVDDVCGSFGVVVSIWGGNVVVDVETFCVVVFIWGGKVGVVVDGTLGVFVVVDSFCRNGGNVVSPFLNTFINCGKDKSSIILVNDGCVESPSLFFVGFVEFPSLFFVRNGNVKLKSK